MQVQLSNKLNSIMEALAVFTEKLPMGAGEGGDVHCIDSTLG